MNYLKLAQLQKNLGIAFKNQKLLILALTHRSIGKKNNERLEFLGDSVLNLSITETLFEKFPNAPEGQLTRFRADLVKGTTLANLARIFELGEHLILGTGEQKSGGHQRSSILADTFEAIIGAYYLEQGFDQTKTQIQSWFGEKLQSLRQQNYSYKDAKTTLQEYCQSQNLALPEYRVRLISGQAHQQQFHVECLLGEKPDIFEGIGESRKVAEQQAAEKALSALGVSYG